MSSTMIGRISVAAVMLALFGCAHPAFARDSCPTTDNPVNHLNDPTKYKSPASVGPSGFSYSADSGDVLPFGIGVARTCGSWDISHGAPGQGHLWIATYGLVCSNGVCSPYVAAGNDRAGNPDNSDPGCAPGRNDCRRHKTGTYVCVSTNGQPSYGPGLTGTVKCPVDQ